VQIFVNGQRSLIDFCAFSADVLVKRGAEVSTDNHLLVFLNKVALADKDERPLRTAHRPYSDPECTADTEWRLFKAAVASTAAQVRERKRFGVANYGKKSNPW